MGTRATYEFEDQNRIMKNIVFYAHFDGYPDGAAERFSNMIEFLYQQELEYNFLLSEKRGGLSHAFLRGNADAEITQGKDFHGDTEWHYKVYKNEENKYIVDAYEITRYWGEDRDSDFTLVMSLPLMNFINMGKYSKDEIVKIEPEGFHDKQEIFMHKNQLEDFRVKGYEALAKFDTNNPNYKTLKTYIDAIEDRIEESAEPEIKF